VGGREVHLTPAEYRLLSHLALNAGRILVPEELLRRVWGPGYEGQHEVLHTTVRRLRRKVEPDPAAPRYVLTRRRIGYLLAAPGDLPGPGPRPGQGSTYP
jgi:two-component system, OmpR family, KDP operon response regulator KdpE